MLYESYSGKQRRAMTIRDNQQLDIFQFAFNSTEYFVNGTKCERRPFNAPWISYWDWLKNSTHGGTCSTKKIMGSLWTTSQIFYNFFFFYHFLNFFLVLGQFHLKLCAQTSTNTPLVLTVLDGGLETQTVFNTFTPGVPAASNFQLPSQCWNA